MDELTPRDGSPAVEDIDKPTDPRELVLWFARSQLGSTDARPYWLDAWGHLPDHALAWCGVFALWCLRQAQITDWTWVLGKGFAYKLGRAKVPQPGDVAYFDKPYQHHALVVSIDNDALYLIQGNYGVPGRVALSLVSVKAKRPAYYSLARLLLTPPAPS